MGHFDVANVGQMPYMCPIDKTTLSPPPPPPGCEVGPSVELLFYNLFNIKLRLTALSGT